MTFTNVGTKKVKKKKKAFDTTHPGTFTIYPGQFWLRAESLPTS